MNEMLLARDANPTWKALSEQRGLSDGNPGGPLTFVWNDENRHRRGTTSMLDCRPQRDMGADYRSRAYTYHLRITDIPLGLARPEPVVSG